MKIGAIIQARCGSTRLPNKVLLGLPYQSGISVLQQDIRRLRGSKLINDIIIATTTQPEDQQIVNLVKKESVAWYCGSVDDVLSRYYSAAAENKLDLVVRVTSDCPCIDYQIIDNLIEEHLKNQADYTTNGRSKTYPHGLDAEIINFSALSQAQQEATSAFDREHVSPYIHNNPQKFKGLHLTAPTALARPDIRITLDTKEDYCLLCAVYDYLYSPKEYFSALEIVQLFERKPWLSIITERIVNKAAGVLTLEQELLAAAKILELQEYKQAKAVIDKYIAENKFS